MKYTLLPRTELTVSRIALGCWGFAGGSMWGPQDEKSSIDTIHTALDNGINFLDTAEGYGDGYSEEVIGKALQNRRQDAVIATKVSADRLQASEVKKACEASLSRLQTDYIDLYQIHWPSTDGTPIEETCGAMDDLIQEGKVRFFGVCNFARKNLTELLPVKKPASNQLSYAWPLHQPMVSAVLAGARTPEQAIRNAEIADISLDDDILRKLDEATSVLKEPFGLNADMWQSPGRME